MDDRRWAHAAAGGGRLPAAVMVGPPHHPSPHGERHASRSRSVALPCTPFRCPLARGSPPAYTVGVGPFVRWTARQRGPRRRNAGTAGGGTEQEWDRVPLRSPPCQPGLIHT
ncbi:hypothetical protein I4F81_010237 [Pyropia yezoensis]|uniref:Uncharacterized protein n=1 Tax=Pyropia yezoensis TaxID=2788 RepID=A0ACC3CBX1_PYRYE|nr:hypothetical protein I4F81_010237 [Neopyropia yezoensis]